MRFEIVSAPVEQRIHSRLQEQTDAAVETLYTIAETLNNKTNRTLNATLGVLSDKEYVSDLSRHAFHLLSPTSLPGTLLVLACIFRLVYALVVHRMAMHACKTQSKRSKSD
jgi:hypothetical protein